MTDLAVLTGAECDLLAECEQTIERGLKTFTEVGRALMSVRDNRLYRADFGTFEAYCAERWGFSDSRARQLISAAETVTTVTVAGLPAPANEGQARELARVPEPERAEVWRETVERTGGKPTAAAVREVHEERLHTAVTGQWYCQDCAHSWPVEPGQGATCPACGGRGGFEPPELKTYKDEEGEKYVIPPATLGDASGSPQAIADQIATEKRKPIVEAEWSDEEEALFERIGAGETIVVSLRGRHANLIQWAEAEGVYVRIDRRTEWGNPFEMPGDGDREQVIASYEKHYLPHKPSLLARLPELRGKALGCWCAPEACHGDVLAKVAGQC